MYFFLGNLSFLDICYTTSSVPLIFDRLLDPQENHLLLSLCHADVPLFTIVGTEYVLLSMMALHRYVAICNSLRYSVIVSKAAYLPMAVGS